MLVGLLGGVGAVARFLLDGSIGARVARDFPYGTLTVNLIGSVLLGVLVGMTVGSDTYRIAATGLLGSFTTFSTWAFESHRLGEDGQPRPAAVNLAASLVLGVGAVWAGRHLGAAM